MSGGRSLRRGALVAAVALVGACGGSEGSDEAAVGGPGESVEVLAVDNVFRRESLKVLSGTTVVWTNKGRNAHDIAPVDGTDTWGVALADFPAGATYSFTFDEPGTYAYYCSVHGTKTAGMIGEIVVE